MGQPDVVRLVIIITVPIIIAISIFMYFFQSKFYPKQKDSDFDAPNSKQTKPVTYNPQAIQDLREEEAADLQYLGSEVMKRENNE